MGTVRLSRREGGREAAVEVYGLQRSVRKKRGEEVLGKA